MIGSARRYYLGKAWNAERDGQTAVAMVFQTKRRAEAGTPFPSWLPYQAELMAAGYEVLEDLRGAAEAELRWRRIGSYEAGKILQALKANSGPFSSAFSSAFGA